LASEERSMSDLKTRPTGADVEGFLESIADERQRADCREIAVMMREITGAEARMWGPSIVGFGSYHYRYASGREGDWMITGFSPRKQNTTLYLTYGLENKAELLSRLGKHTTGKACLYIKRLSDVDRAVLRELIAQSVADMRRNNE
jgi:hypothetical protein